MDLAIAATAPTVIREATPADLDTLVSLGERFRSETVYAEVMAHNPAQLRATAARLIEQADSAILVSEREGAITGMIGLTKYGHFISGRPVTAEVFWWSQPDAPGDGARLFYRARQWAAEHGTEQLFMSAPTERLTRLYERMGMRLLEQTFVEAVIPAYPFTVDGITVFDHVLADPVLYRLDALRQVFREESDGVVAFCGIAPPPTGELVEWVQARLPHLEPQLSFLRKSPKGQEEPHYVHSDRSMGTWTGILYLNPRPPADDGTTFWRDRDSGEVASLSTTPEAYAAEGARQMQTEHFDPWYRVPAKFNRLVMFRAALLHSRSIRENHGQGDDARLIQVIFGGTR